MTTYATVAMGQWVNTTVVTLPSGSDGDELMMIGYVPSNVSQSGWTLVASHTLAIGRYRIWTKTRAGGETTVTLGNATGAGAHNHYSLINVAAGTTVVEAPAPQNDTTSTWTVSGAYDRDPPRFAVGHLLADGAGLSISGDFSQQQTYTPSGSDDVYRLYVADVGSGTIDVSASGAWTDGGHMAWLTVFYSAAVSVNRKWWVGVVGWGPDSEVGA